GFGRTFSLHLASMSCRRGSAHCQSTKPGNEPGQVCLCSWAKFAQALANALCLGTMRARIRRAGTCARQTVLRHPAAKRLVGSPAPTASKVCEGEVKPIHLRAPDLHGQAEL